MAKMPNPSPKQLRKMIKQGLLKESEAPPHAFMRKPPPPPPAPPKRYP